MVKEQALPRAKKASKLKAAMVYVLVLGLMILTWAALMGYVYPRKLTFTAPELREALPEWAMDYLPDGRTAGLSGEKLYRAYENRDRAWQLVMSVCQALGLAAMLLVQLLWRAGAGWGKWPLYRAARRAIRRYYLAMLVIFAAESALGLLLWYIGLRHIVGAGVWDYAVCLAPLALCVPGAAVLCRWAAPGTISGRHGYFHRL